MLARLIATVGALAFAAALSGPLHADAAGANAIQITSIKKA